mmetsp:Transcript_235/g.547  ORF Transcript_235/g.547 Transcript_235/m.547 type:complete len:146 (-) Transcript_235:512-949(-)
MRRTLLFQSSGRGPPVEAPTTSTLDRISALLREALVPVEVAAAADDDDEDEEDEDGEDEEVEDEDEAEGAQLAWRPLEAGPRRSLEPSRRRDDDRLHDERGREARAIPLLQVIIAIVIVRRLRVCWFVGERVGEGGRALSKTEST